MADQRHTPGLSMEAFGRGAASQFVQLQARIENLETEKAEITAERDRLREEIKGLNERIEELRDAAVTHYNKLYGATAQTESGEKESGDDKA